MFDGYFSVLLALFLFGAIIQGLVSLFRHLADVASEKREDHQYRSKLTVLAGRIENINTDALKTEWQNLENLHHSVSGSLQQKYNFILQPELYATSLLRSFNPGPSDGSSQAEIKNERSSRL